MKDKEKDERKMEREGRSDSMGRRKRQISWQSNLNLISFNKNIVTRAELI